MEKKRKVSILGLLLLIGIALYLNEEIKQTMVERETDNPVIVIDSGHGGVDPGKVGIHGELEKDINLSIAKKTRVLLEEAGVEVVMTREEDVGLYREGDTNKKVSDMRKRVQIIEESKALLTVSIHQNSYTQESSQGAQVFYYTKSEEAKKLAEALQTQLKLIAKKENNRTAKSNDTYFMLKKTQCPCVIVECGFLSNGEEAQLLTTEKYQEELAAAICAGVVEYLEK